MTTFWKQLILIVVSCVLLLATFFLGLHIFFAWNNNQGSYAMNTTTNGEMCNIAVIPIKGDIVPIPNAEDDTTITTNADDTLAMIRSAEADPNIKGILVPIDSGGGTSVASEIIANALKISKLPSVALIREMGASGAYLIATGARTIIASAFSDVGSIGITMSYIENVGANKKEGFDFVPLASAQFKDYMNPDKPLTTEERLLLERDLNIWHKHFVKEVAENRNLPLEDIAKLADGSSMPGELALQNKLIDAIGDQETAREWFEKELGEGIIFCE